MIDPDGNASAENFHDLTAIGGWNGTTRLLALSVPKDPEPQPKLPAEPADHE